MEKLIDISYIYKNGLSFGMLFAKGNANIYLNKM